VTNLPNWDRVSKADIVCLNIMSAAGSSTSADVTDDLKKGIKIRQHVLSCSKKFSETNEVDLLDYSKIVIEVAEILQCMGVVFKWAIADIVTKARLVESTGEPYFARILEMDKKNNQLFPNDTIKKESRTRSLNRMTHVLQLTCGIYEGVAAGSDDSLSDIVSKAYTKTLCRIHAWVVQQMVRAGIYVVPSREDFLKTCNWDLKNPEEKMRLDDTFKQISIFASRIEKNFEDAKIKWIA